MTAEQALAQLRRRSTLKESLHQSLAAIGGVLRCETCKAIQPLGDVVNRIYGQDGWPTHCGYTMRWVTGRQLREELAQQKGKS